MRSSPSETPPLNIEIAQPRVAVGLRNREQLLQIDVEADHPSAWFHCVRHLLDCVLRALKMAEQQPTMCEVEGVMRQAGGIDVRLKKAHVDDAGIGAELSCDGKLISACIQSQNRAARSNLPRQPWNGRPRSATKIHHLLTRMNAN